MFSDLIGYHIYQHDPLPPLAPQHAYDYVLAANGVFMRAQSPMMQVCIPICNTAVRGLRPLQPAIHLIHGRLPSAMLQHCITDARQATTEQNHLLETLYHVHLIEGHYRLVKPPQSATTGNVTTVTVYPQTLLDLHTHGDSAAFFSATDNRDEQGLRFYGVLGKVRDREPEMRLRLGCYGYFYECPLETLFLDGQVNALVRL